MASNPRKQSSTDISFKRTISDVEAAGAQQLNFGEPFFVDNTTYENEVLQTPCNAYLYLGRKAKTGEQQDDISAASSPVFKALTKSKADSLVFYNSTDGSIRNENDDVLSVTKLKVATVDALEETADKFFILTQGNDNSDLVKKFNLGGDQSDIGIYVTKNGVMHGAAWNDYAENRPISGEANPGNVVCDLGDGCVGLSDEHLQVCGHVVSDTYGYTLDAKEENSVPIAVAGRVLVYVNGTPELGDCLCAGEDGVANIMTRPEIINYPDRILGTVSEIPSYDTWHNIDVDGRVWMNVK